jgi:hypothetical protein
LGGDKLSMIYYQQSIGILRAHTLACAFSPEKSTPFERNRLSFSTTMSLYLRLWGRTISPRISTRGGGSAPCSCHRNMPEYARVPLHRIARHRATNEVHAGAPVLPVNSALIEWGRGRRIPWGV